MKRLSMLAIALLLMFALSACGGGGKNGGGLGEVTVLHGSGSSSAGAASEPETESRGNDGANAPDNAENGQEQANSPDSSRPQDGDLNPDLIGVWGCGWSGASHYYHFRADGSFYYRNYHGGPSLLVKGNWHESGGTIYFTNRKMVSFNASDVPDSIEYMAWTELDDETMRINLGVIGEDEYSSRYFGSEYAGLKYFYDWDVFNDGDGSLPRSYRSFIFDEAPNWAFPYRIFEYDAAGNYVGHAEGYNSVG